MEIILASQSPRRRELLERMGLSFSVRAADIDEAMEPGKDPAQEVARVSRAKAMAAPAGPQDVVIAADTIVVCGGRILGKPGTEERAAEMLRLLSGRDHQVMTGFTVRRGSTVLTQTEVSHIFFRPLDEGEIDAYVATGEPLDKAGACCSMPPSSGGRVGGFSSPLPPVPGNPPRRTSGCSTRASSPCGAV